MPEQIFLYIGIVLFILHEIDAIRCKEWRIFPGLSLLNEQMGYVLFLLAHIPLFFLIYEGLTPIQSSSAFIKGFDIFMILHLIVHLLFIKHKKNEFKDYISWTLITGIAICGILDLTKDSCSYLMFSFHPINNNTLNI